MSGGNPFAELLGDFLLESRERIARVEVALLAIAEHPDSGRAAHVDLIKRELHTLKGNSGMMGMEEIQRLSHALEDDLESALEDDDVGTLLERLDALGELLDAADQQNTSKASSGNSSLLTRGVRVQFTVLDSLVDDIAEMVVLHNQLSSGAGRDTSASEHSTSSTWANQAHQALGIALRGAHERVLSMRMVPLEALFLSLRRVIHDETDRTGKLVEIDISGGDTPLDKALYEIASDVLGHIVRNAVIHGIESPESRGKSGKPAAGRIEIHAASTSNELVIDVRDDGAGIDREALARRASSAGLEVEDLESLVFRAGITTRGEADIGSGRGVGLSAVADTLKRCGGSIELQSEAGVGTHFRLRMPLSISMLRALILRARGERFAMPLSCVVSCGQLSEVEIRDLHHSRVLRRGSEVLPLIDLSLVISDADEELARDRGAFVVIEARGRQLAVRTDEIGELRDVVIKPLDPMIEDASTFLGSTILSDGQPALVLNPASFAPDATIPPAELA